MSDCSPKYPQYKYPEFLDGERMEIAKRYLVPKQMEMHKLKTNEFRLTDTALLRVIRY